MNYSQIMSPRPHLPRKVGGHDPPSSYGSAAPGRAPASICDNRRVPQSTASVWIWFRRCAAQNKKRSYRKQVALSHCGQIRQYK